MKLQRFLSVFCSAALVLGLSFSTITCGGGDDDGGGALSLEQLQEELADGKTAAELLVTYPVADMDDTVRSALGKEALSESDPASAVICFQAVTNTDAALYGEAQYGILMAHFQRFASQIGESLSLLDMVSGLAESSAPIEPQQGDIWESMIVSMGGIDVMVEIMEDIQAQAETVVNNGYTFTLDDFPFIIGEETGDVFVEVLVDGQNGELAARVLWMVADIAIAAINYLGAHAWDMNLSTMMGHLTELTGLTSGIAGADLIGLVRGFAWLPQENPNFFSKSTRWATNMATINSLVSSGAANLTELDSAIVDTAVGSDSACTLSTCLIDLDSSGTISAGDQFLLRGSVHVALGAGLFALAGGLTSDTISQINDVAAVLDDYGIDISASAAAGMVIDIDLTSTEVLGTTAMLTSMLAGALPALETLLDIVVDSLGGTDVVEATDINPVLTALGLPAVPNVLSLDLSKFMDMPIGDLMGYYCVNANDQPVTCGTGTTPVFPLEVEMLSVSTQCAALGICGSAPYPPYYMEGDNAHFAGTSFAFDADGLVPVDAGAAALSTDILLYVAMPDPTMNGALKLDLATLPAVCGGTETASGFTPATLQGGNIVVNCLILDYLPKLEASTFYTDVYPLIEPFVAMLGL